MERLAMVRSYDAAKQLKEECERLMADEAAAAGQRATEAMRTDFAQLKERQTREVACFVEHARAHIIRIEAQRDAELRANENLRKKLEGRLAANRRPGIIAPKIKAARSSPSPISTGTLLQLTSFRKQPDTARLAVRIDGLEAAAKAAGGHQAARI
jgi:hypothetical protein